MEKPKDPAVLLAELQAEVEARDPRPVYMRSAMWATGGSSALLALGAVTPNVEFGSMLSVFSLAGVCGYYTVWGVAHALHSPLMAVTNAISGMTAVSEVFHNITTHNPPSTIHHPSIHPSIHHGRFATTTGITTTTTLLRRLAASCS